MSVANGTLPPVTPSDLADWLAESLRADLKVVQAKVLKSYRVQNVTLAERIGPDRLIYHMYSPGGEQPPEDVPGTLVTDRGEFQGIVRRQRSGSIHMEVVWPLAPEEFMESATFQIDCQAFVEDLIGRLEQETERMSPLAVDLFNPAASDEPEGGSPSENQLVYVWTPPGEAQADTLAGLIVESLAAGERVLVATHSNQALDNLASAIMDLDTAWGREAVRWGWTDCETVKKYLDQGQKAESASGPATDLTEKLACIEEAVVACRKNIAHWVRIHTVKREFVVQETLFRQKHVEWQTQKAVVDRVAREWLRCQAELNTSRKAWFNRAARMQNASEACRDVAVRLGEAEADVGLCRQEKDRLERRLAEMAGELAGLEEICRDLPSTSELGEKLRRLEHEKEQLVEDIQKAAQAKSVQSETPTQARLVLTTLNEGCESDQLAALDFHTVVITGAEKIPTAQIFLAAGRAGKRVILAGDFFYFSFETPVKERGGGMWPEKAQTTLTYQDLKKSAGSKKGRIQVIMDGSSGLPQPMADLVLDLAYRPAGLTFSGVRATSQPYSGPRVEPIGAYPLAMADTSGLNGWCGKSLGSLSPFNLTSALSAVQMAQSALRNQPVETKTPPRVLLVSSFSAQVRLLAALIEDLGLTGRVAAGTPADLEPADFVIFDAVLDQPIVIDRFTDPESAVDAKAELAQAVALAHHRFILLGSSSWLDKRAKAGSALFGLADHIQTHGAVLPVERMLTAVGRPDQKRDVSRALASATVSVFGFLPFFDAEQRPTFEAAVRGAVERGVDVTLLDSLPGGVAAEETNGLIQIPGLSGAVLIPATGYQGAELIIDRRIIFWGREQLGFPYQLNTPKTVDVYLTLLQADEIRTKSIGDQGAPRICPECGGLLLSAFQATRQGTSDPQPFKIKCQNKKCKYVRPLDERLPYAAPPTCPVDGQTLYERVKRGRGEVWQCPAHPKTCPVEKVVPGDVT